MTQMESFQLSLEAAEAYESKFVPRLFAEWAPLVVSAAGATSGDAVLDVACGTGVVAREAVRVVGPSGRVVGIDVNDSMLAVARRIAPEIEWLRGDAAHLAVDTDAFDAVVCQAGLMFFPDPVTALREMARAARRDGTVAVQVWATLDAQPAYGAFVDVAATHAGHEAVNLLGAYWALGDLERLTTLCADAGLDVLDARSHEGTARFPSLDEMVAIEVEGTPLAERINDDTYAAILAGTREILAPFEAADGSAALPIIGRIVTARKMT